jgi:hypothetical protein
VVLLRFGFVPIVLLALWVYCILDVIATDDVLVRNLPKGVWLLIVIFLPDIGSLAWLLLGRPLYAGWRPGDTTQRPPKRVVGPEDRDDFPSGRIRPAPPPPLAPRPPEPPSLQSREDQLAAREEELRRREEHLRQQEEERRREQGDQTGPNEPSP